MRADIATGAGGRKGEKSGVGKRARCLNKKGPSWRALFRFREKGED
tara:strand:+ start:188 stop:325 length:138 start_codon:yes stop_codon:yes gene_type:complete